MHLAYALELPDHPGPVQKALKIAPEGSLVLSVKNPEKGSPRYAGLSDEREVTYPKALQKEFGNRRFTPGEPRLLDFEGAEFLLIGAEADISEDLGSDLEPEHETAQTADIIEQLRLAKADHPTEPLFKGSWR